MTVYSIEMAEKVCAAIACGDSIEKLCQSPDMPGERTIYEWLIRYPEFLIKYDLAKEKQMEKFANEIIDLADKCGANTDAAAKAKLQIETRKWLMGKMKPKKYGDNMTIKGDADNPIQINLATALDARIAAARAAPVIEHEASSAALPVIDCESE